MEVIVAINRCTDRTEAIAEAHGAKGLILDLNADKDVEVEDGDRVVKWTNQVSTFSARDFVKQDQGRKLQQSVESLKNTYAIK